MDVQQYLASCTIVALAACLCPADAAAQGPWSVRFGAEHSSITIGDTETDWEQQSVNLAYTNEAKGGWRGVVERHGRWGREDYVFTTGGFLRLGDWTVAGSASSTADAEFWFTRAWDAEVSRRLIGTMVASVGYRYMDFGVAEIHQAQTALTVYHARGSVEGRLYGTRNRTLDRDSLTVLGRSFLRVHPRVELAAAVAKGDRIFDIASLPEGRADAWTVWGGFVMKVTRRDEITVGAGMAREDPSFEQRTLTVAYRRLF